MMTYEEFVKIIDKVGPGANHVMFYYMGEPFLNKEVLSNDSVCKGHGLVCHDLHQWRCGRSGKAV